MPGLTNTAGVQQTPVPVPLPPMLQQQFQPQVQPQPGNAAPSTSRPSGAGTASAPADSQVPPMSLASSSNTQPSPALSLPPVPAQSLPPVPTQPAARAAPAPVTQTPVPAPTSLMGSAPVSSTTSTKNATERPPSRKPSLERPKVEPLTPPLGPVQFPPPRQSHAYPNHVEQQTAIPPPAPAPIEYDSNPDVLALKSAISILQLQSAKAKRDMVTLQSAKEAALADPEAFIKDLNEGKVHMGGRGLESSLADDEDDEDEDDGDDDTADVGKEGNGPSGVKDEPGTMAVDKQSRAKKPQPKPWSQLPNKQNVVRMPPINWSQYAVVGESLDKLHNEQVARPSQGTPATIGPDGAFVFQGAGRQEEYSGIAAPFDPLKDKLKPEEGESSKSGQATAHLPGQQTLPPGASGSLAKQDSKKAKRRTLKPKSRKPPARPKEGEASAPQAQKPKESQAGGPKPPAQKPLNRNAKGQFSKS
ncbi:hypothetical protein AB5N19_07272 [Seiridium cardinale]